MKIIQSEISTWPINRIGKGAKVDREAYYAATKQAWDEAWDYINVHKRIAWKKYHQEVVSAVRTYLNEPDYIGTEPPEQFPKPPLGIIPATTEN